jgi:hypothetical protein
MKRVRAKYDLESLESFLRFMIPSRKLVGRILILSLAFIFTTGQFLLLCLNAFVSEPIYTPQMVSFPFALLLMFLSVLVVLELLWLLIGLEVVEVDGNNIVIKHQVLGFGITRKLSLNKVNGVFVSRHYNKDWNNLSDYLASRESRLFFFSFTQGKVAINYGQTVLGGINTIRFGSNLDEGEAKQIVKLIHEKFPQYIYVKSKNTG